MTFVPVSAIAERRMVEHLRRYRAVRPEKTMGYAPIRWSHARALARLRETGVVKGRTARSISTKLFGRSAAASAAGAH